MRDNELAWGLLVHTALILVLGQSADSKKYVINTYVKSSYQIVHSLDS